MIPFYITPTDMSLDADLIWPDQTPPGQGKRHRAQMAAAKRGKPDGLQPEETRQRRRQRERQEGKHTNG